MKLPINPAEPLWRKDWPRRFLARCRQIGVLVAWHCCQQPRAPDTLFSKATACVFGCAGSLLLPVGLLWLQRADSARIVVSGLLLWGTGSVVVADGLICPDQGSNLVPALAGRFSITEPPRKSRQQLFLSLFCQVPTSQ